MESVDEKRLLDRLARVEGQVRGLRKMLEEQRTCEDVLNQLLAARSGLEQAGLLVLERHLADCVLNEASLSPEASERLREVLRMWGRHAG
jgi:DNA-binding FrmR family transcriptional regulator